MVAGTPHALVGRAADLAVFAANGVGWRALAETEHLRVVVAALEDGQQIPLHAPARDLVMAIMEGVGQVYAGDGAHDVRAGDVIVVPAGETRGLRALGGRLVAVTVVSPPPGPEDHQPAGASWPAPEEAPDVAALVLEEHGALLPQVRGLGDLAADAPALGEPQLRQRLAGALDFLRHGLLPHAAEEERSVYPAVEAVLRAVGGATRTMSTDHRVIAEMVAALGEVAGGPLSEGGRERARQLLTALQAVLELHLTKENEVYVPLLDRLPAAERRALHQRLAGGGG